MDTVELVGLLIPFMYFVMQAVKARWPARPLPPRRGWRCIGVGFLLLIASIGAMVPLLLPLDWWPRNARSTARVWA